MFLCHLPLVDHNDFAVMQRKLSETQSNASYKEMVSLRNLNHALLC